MSSTTVATVQSHLDALLRYLQPHLAFVNCHMVGYLTENLWQKHVPEAIRQEVQSAADVDAAVQVFWDFHHSDADTVTASAAAGRFGGLVEFLRTAQAHRSSRLSPQLVLTAAQMEDRLRRTNSSEPSLQIKDFMSEKKSHEVEIAAQLVAALCESPTVNGTPSLSVIDAGDGKGYLSSRLALEHRLNVLGIDANEGNTQGALKRSAQLERAWSGLTKRAEDVRNGITPPRKGRRKRGPPSQNDSDAPPEQPSDTTLANYQRSTHFITPETDFPQLFAEHFPDCSVATVGFCLSGLHTCGNLAPSCLHIFRHNAAIRTLCNVGCCYHLIDEQFVENDFFVEHHQKDRTSATVGFPMSAHLRDQRSALGRNARMLASQSLERTVAARELPGRSLFYRALLEVLIAERRPELGNCVQVGRMKGVDALRFGEYVARCVRRLGADALPVDVAEVERREAALMAEYGLQQRRMELFYLVRQTFAPVLETVILLDRLLYLKECGVEEAYLVQLFDPVVSPRSVAVVALKANDAE